MVAATAALWLGASLAACGSDDAGEGDSGGYTGSGAAGGESTGTGDTSGTTTSGISSSVSSSAGNGGGHGTGGAGTGVGGGGGAPVRECLAECAVDYSDGQAPYELYAGCIYCGQCAVDCADRTEGMCLEPAVGDACDYTGDCSLCADCANGSACSEEADACNTQPDCVAYANCIAACQQY